MARTPPDTFAAVDTASFRDLSLTAANADSFGGTSFDTVDAALAMLCRKPD